MSYSNINPKDVIFSLDIGTRSVIGTVGIVKEKKFHVIAESYLEHQERAMIDGQIHDIGLVALTVSNVKRDIEKKVGFSLDSVVIAAAGRFLRTVVTKSEIEIDESKEIDKDAIRSLELTAVKKAEDDIGKEMEGKLYCVGYSIKNYYLNGYVISNLLAHKGEKIAAEIIATFLPRTVIESLYSVMDRVGLNVISLTLEPIAAMEAAIPKNLRLLNLALVDIGAGTSDIAISSNDTISAYAMVPMAGDEISEVIAQNYLVDFNTAEKIKRDCIVNEKVTYMDIMGIENEIESTEVINLVSPTAKKIADEIGNQIIELNGGKSPNAVFMVGGGAHTPKLREFIAEKLGLTVQRVGIKGRESISECVCSDNSLGSIGVTVLGIALVSIKKLGHDFIDVILNGNVISLFNSHKHTVMDVMLHGGINPKLLIGRNGKNIRFKLNKNKRIAFGSLAVNAQIMINGEKGTIDSEVKEGDVINIDFAKDGKDAEPKIIDFVQQVYCVSFFINDLIENLEPVVIVNDKREELEYKIKEGDNIEIVYPKTLAEYIKYFAQKQEKYIYVLDDAELNEDYVIKEEDRIYKREKDIDISLTEELAIEGMSTDIIENEGNFISESVATESTNTVSLVNAVKENPKKDICVFVNDKPTYLKNKDKYVFVDIFNSIQFDLSTPKGKLVLTLNDKNAGYYDELKDGDIIKIFWEK